jgi:CBS domain-containing protein
MFNSSNLRAEDVMTRNVLTVFPHSSIRHAAKVMAENHISGLPVVTENGTVIGLISEGDLMSWSDEPGERQAWWLNMLAEGYDLAPNFLDVVQAERENVKSVMSRDVATIGANMTLTEIAKLLVEKRLKRLPVARSGKLIGIVSRADLVRALAQC